MLLPNGARLFGQAIADTATTARLAQLSAAPETFNGRTIRVEGTVVAVCQEMGCWMEMRDENTQAHVRMHGHSFFLPRDVDGHRAVVQATVVPTHRPTHCDEEAQHVTGQLAQIELDATGVQVFN